MSRRIKLWTGLGAFVLAGTGAADVPDLTADKADARPLAASVSGALGGASDPLLLAQGGEQGERGEGGEAGERGEGGEGGEAGERGEGGEAGEAGERGEGGEAGEAGEMGEAGERGERGEGGEGGEGGEAGHGAGDLSDPAVFGAQLLMMHGHLSAAAQLAEAGETEMATPHLSHPLDEHYGALEGALDTHGVDGFQDELNVVSGLEPGSNDLPGAIAAAQERIMAALETLPPGTRLAALGPLVHTLAEEYEEGVADGQVVNLEEYQDAWGFLQAARGVVESVPSDAVSEADLTDIKAALDTLAEALPSAVPPDSGLAEVGRVKAAASEIELITSTL